MLVCNICFIKLLFIAGYAIKVSPYLKINNANLLQSMCVWVNIVYFT